MKKTSVKMKITVWVFLLTIIIAAVSALTVLFLSDSVTQSATKRSLIAAVEGNVDEILIYSERQDARLDDEFDVLVESEGFFLVIDDDFTKETDDVTTALFGGSSVLYGDSVIDAEAFPLAETGIREIKSGTTRYYIYDHRVNGNISNSLWLRGIVSKETGVRQMLGILDGYLVMLPLLLLAAIAGAFVLAGRAMKPVEDISRSADEIRRGTDLTKRLSLPPTGAEPDALVASFNAMLERLEESFERERRFSADISHELRTPISVILSSCELALEETEEAQYIESLELIQRQGTKMRDMVNRMLEYSRLETDAFHPERLNFSALTEAVCGEMRLLAERGITLTAKVEENIFVNGDKALLSRLLINLINNAFRYGRDGGFVAVTLKTDADLAVLSVKDNGIGIRQEDAERIFNAFYRADSARTGKGFGLGLSFVKRIAAMHGGEIRVQSIEGAGSEFIFTQKILKNN